MFSDRTFTESCRERTQAARAALGRALDRVEALAPMVLSREEARDMLDTCGEFRASAASFDCPIAFAGEFVDSDDTVAREARVVKGETDALLRELEEFVVVVGTIATELTSRIKAGA